VDLPGDATDDALRDRLLVALRAFEPPPSAIVFTGGGFQAVWRFPHLLPSPDHNDRIEKINTTIWQQLPGGDRCHDVSRLLRLPGTINVPNKTKRDRGRVPVLAAVLDADWTRTWSFERDPVPRTPEATSPLPERDEIALQSPSSLLTSLPATLQKAITVGDATRYEGDRSKLGWYVVMSLLRRAWSDDDIASLLLTRTNGISGHYLDQPNSRDYVARTLASAREAMKKDWNRHPKTLEILPRDQDNVDRALSLLNIKLSYDSFADKIWVNGAGPAKKLDDAIIDELWFRCQREFNYLPDLMFFSKLVMTRARENSYHPVLDYLAQIQPTWDQTQRLDTWLTIYGGAEDTPFNRAVGRLTLVAACRRVRQPGCKYDEMLMLISTRQGTDKSGAIRELSVDPERWFHDYLPLGAEGKEVIENVRGRWLIEAQERAGMTTRDVDKIKAFCSRQVDRGRMSYDRLVSDVPRACIFIGTSNEDNLFTDLTNRRFWPVVVQRFDLDALRRDRDQLWAEAAQAEAANESIRLHPDLWPAATDVQDKFKVEDAWATAFDQVLQNLNGRVTSADLYKIINKPTGQILHADGRRLARAMREIGFERQQFRTPHSPNPQWFYVRAQTPLEARRDIFIQRDPVTQEVSAFYADDDTSTHHSNPDEFPL
jgi:predicted P-loop ATPase